MRCKLGGAGVVREEALVVAEGRIARLGESGDDRVRIMWGDIVQVPAATIDLQAAPVAQLVLAGTATPAAV